MARLAILKSDFVDRIEGESKWAEDGGRETGEETLPVIPVRGGCELCFDGNVMTPSTVWSK